MRWMYLLLAACGGGGSASPDATAPTADGSQDALPGSAFTETFATDGGWPAGWTMLGGVARAQVVSGKAELAPTYSDYSLARMGHALDNARDVEVTYDIAFTNLAKQGIGFYVRQNGGYLQHGATHGQGYAVFVEGFRGAQIGIWRELNGIEQEIQPPNAPVTLADAVTYRVRFRCVQNGASTNLAAKLWPVASAEPAAWTIERTDATAELQNISGGIAVDSWNNDKTGTTAPSTVIDNIDVVLQ